MHIICILCKYSPLPPLLLLVDCTLLFLITGDATVIWKQGDRVIFADKIHVSTEMRASIVDRTSLLLRGVDTQYTGKNPIVCTKISVFEKYCPNCTTKIIYMGICFLINQLAYQPQNRYIAYQYLYCRTFFINLPYTKYLI